MNIIFYDESEAEKIIYKTHSCDLWFLANELNHFQTVNVYIEL